MFAVAPLPAPAIDARLWHEFRSELLRTAVPVAWATGVGLACKEAGAWDCLTPLPPGAAWEVTCVDACQGRLGEVGLGVAPGAEALLRPFVGLITAALRTVELARNQAGALGDSRPGLDFPARGHSKLYGLRPASLSHERLRQEVEVGSQIQEALLTGVPPPNAKWTVATLSLPSRRVDGDFFDFFAHGPDVMDLVVGDVMGKGVPAALIGAATKNHILRAINALHAPGLPFPPPAGQILARTRREVAPQLMNLERFVTLCYARFDARRECLELIDCGHTKTLHRVERTNEVHFLQGSNTPLGFTHAEDDEPLRVPFAGGDVFFFYSDGLTESVGAGGERFGEGRLADLIRAGASLSPDELIASVRRAVEVFTAGRPAADDLTCIAVRIAKKRLRSVELTSAMTELPRIRAFVQETTAALPNPKLSAQARQELLVTVTEAATNIFRHSYGGRRDRPLVVEVEPLADRVVVHLWHRGEPFEFPAAPAEPPRCGQESGMGLYIIQQYATNVASESDAARGHCVRLEKRFTHSSF
jgi:sigma-B regulation protein RsbU (phosphoserine phosphatase)